MVYNQSLTSPFAIIAHLTSKHAGVLNVYIIVKLMTHVYRIIREQAHLEASSSQDLTVYCY